MPRLLFQMRSLQIIVQPVLLKPEDLLQKVSFLLVHIPSRLQPQTHPETALIAVLKLL